MDFRLGGKVAFITGGGSGIGQAIAGMLAAEGCNIFITDLDRNRAESAAEICRAEGTRADAVACDVGDPASIASAVDGAARTHGKIDVLVNSAGILRTASILDSTPEDWIAFERVNISGVLNCCRAVMPGMVARRYGKIVNIASVSAFKGGGSLGNTLYGTSKAGVAALTKGSARELGPMGINVNAIAPAVTGNTGMVSPVMPDDMQAAIVRRIPIGRLAKPSDTAALAVFLSSDVAAFISGAIIPVDGGLMTT